jgi:mRNA deadenylase 3'-5' endonuclease subunit Ccr4
MHPFGWEARVDQVSEQINFYHPDIIGIQEDNHYQIKLLKSYLPDYHYVGMNCDNCESLPG